MNPLCMLRLKLCKRALKNVSCTRAFSNDFVQDNIITSGYPDFELPAISLPELVIPKYEKYEKYIAFECAETGRKYTYGQIRTKSKNLQKALRKKLKLKKNDVIGLLLKNIPEYPIAFVGSLEANLTVTTINPTYTTDEVTRQLTASGAKAVITSVELFTSVETACKKAKIKIPIVVIKTKVDQTIPDGAILFSELTDNELDCPNIDPPHPNDVALLPYSSGTTGLPKGVELTHHNLAANIRQLIATQRNYTSDPQGDYQECCPGILPFYHIFGLTSVANMVVMYGGKTVTFSDFSPDLFISEMQNQKNTMMHLVPPLVMFLSAHPAVQKKYLDNVKAVFCGAAPLGAKDAERFHSVFGSHIDVIQGYGLTEASPTVSVCNKRLLYENKTECAGSVGRLLPKTIAKVVSTDDPKNVPLGPQVRGELLVKGPQVMKGYFNNPTETEKTLVDNGWLRTGDEAYYTDNGIIFITDRFKEMVKVKGFQVAPAELEELLRSHPDVADAAVIGIAHATYGEVPRAYVVPKHDKIDLEKLNQFISERVTDYKQLKGGIALIKSIPKNPSGKILRRILKEDCLKQMQL